MAEDTLFQERITKKQFFQDVELAKKVVDSGFKNYFVLLRSSSFKNTRTIGGTTLADIKDCYGGFPVYQQFRFALPHLDWNGEVATASSILIRDLTKSDRAKLRSSVKFFPKNTYIAELSDPDGLTILFPFKQNPDGTRVPLFCNNIYRKTKASGKVLQSHNQIMSETIWQDAERIIELLPDLMDSLLAVVRYKDVDMCIPIEKTTAKKTFRTRDKDGERRAHLIHDVKKHGRKNLKNVDKVKSHLRGRSDFVIDGLDVSLFGSVEWALRDYSERYALSLGINA